MIEVRTAHTSELDEATLTAIQSFLVNAFVDCFDADDWDHTLGGVHALVTQDDGIVAHGAVVQRRLFHGGRALRTGYVEGVAVRADRRRAGVGRAVMTRLADVIRGGYEVGGLSAAEDAARLYRRLGWRRWEGRTWVLGPHGLERTPDDDDSTYVLPVAAALDLSGDLACDWRAGDVW